MFDPLVVLAAERAADGSIADFKVTFANPAFIGLYGGQIASVDGGRLLEMLPDYRTNGLFDAFVTVTETGEPYVEDAFAFIGTDAAGGPKPLTIDLRVVRVGDGVAATGREIGYYLATHDATVASEERFRLLAERSQDVIFKYCTEPEHAFEYVSPSIEALSGYTAAELYADPEIAFQMIHPDDRADFEGRLRDGRLFTEPLLARWVRKDGRIIWTEQTNTEILDEGGRRVAVEGVARDATIRVESMASVAESEARFRSALEGIGMHAAILDRAGRILFVNTYLARRTGWSRDELIGRDSFEVFLEGPDRDAQRQGFVQAIEHETIAETGETEWLARDHTPVRISWTSSFVRDESGAIVGVASVGEDVTERREQEARRARLTAAVEQTAESIVVTGLDGRIVYANPAFEKATGMLATDVIGHRPWAVMHFGRHDPGFRDLIRQVRAGNQWTGEWELRGPGGELRLEEVSVSPVLDSEGSVSGYVSVARDVTRIREIQKALDDSLLQRVAVAHALSQMETRSTAEETAQQFTDAVVGLPGVDVAMLVGFDADGDATVLAVTSGEGYPIVSGMPMPATRAAYLRTRAFDGPWVAPWVTRPEDGEYGTAVARTGLQAVAYAPLMQGSDIVGIFTMGTTSPDIGGRFEDHLSMAVEFAATARSLLSAQLTDRRETGRRRSEINAVLGSGRFRAVFQPIVDMSTGAAIGYEALTRFDDGTPPNLRFAAARRAGVGLELEAATLERAIADSLVLPAGPWVALNVTGEIILAGDRLAGILRKRTRPVVLEITEHDAIADYQAVRAAVAALGPDVRIAIDDAGAGVANFDHIVQLRPDFVKIDAAMVRGVNSDLTRQALIVGLHHFARATNGWVIAEGVETEEERLTLVALEVAFGQGYHFGRPAPAEAWERPQPAVVIPTVEHQGWLRR